MKIEILEQFETLLKKYQTIFFNKVWEKTDKNYKLIYNLQGLLVDNIYYPNLKFIFWLDLNKETITEPVITYLYTQFCDYKSESFSETTLSETFLKILFYLQKENTNQQLSSLIIGNSDLFNAEIAKYQIDDFIQNIKFLPWKLESDAQSCSDTKFNFEIETNLSNYIFSIKCLPTFWLLIYKNERIKIQFNELPKKLITTIYAIDRDNI